MSSWFLYAIASSFFSGGYSFLQKILVEKGYPSYLINSGTQFFVSAMAGTVALFFVNGNISHLFFGAILGALVGVTFMLGSVSRLESLNFIDTAIFFPLYKTVGPLLTLLFGFLFFHEWFTLKELFGLALGITVPLFLIHKSEKNRQKNLWLGLFFMVVAAFFASVSTTISKYGAEILGNIFVFIAISELVGSISGIILYKMQTNKKHKSVFGNINKQFVLLLFVTSVFGFGGYLNLLLAYKHGGPLAAVYTINSFYILVPIVLSIIFYKEHWSPRKAVAILLSITSAVFLH